MSSTYGLRGFLAATRGSGAAAAALPAAHIRATDAQRLADLAESVRDAGVLIIPTEYRAHHDYGWNQTLGGWVSASDVVELPEMGYVPQTVREDWRAGAWTRWDADEIDPETAAAFVEWRTELLTALRRADVPFLMGSEAQAIFNVPGFSLHRELPLLRRAGLSAYQILESGTATVGRYVRENVGAENRFGTVDIGMRADLLLLDGDPRQSLESLARPAGVMADGRWFTGESLAEELESIAERHKDFDPD